MKSIFSSLLKSRYYKLYVDILCKAALCNMNTLDLMSVNVVAADLAASKVSARLLLEDFN
jgi:hypothetical protein